MNSDEAQVKALDAAWNQAYQNRDLETLERILAADWIGLTPEHEVITRAQLLEGQKSAPLDTKIAFKRGSVHLFGSFAISTGETKVEGGDIYIHQRFTRSYLKRNGTWQAIAVQIVPISKF